MKNLDLFELIDYDYNIDLNLPTTVINNFGYEVISRDKVNAWYVINDWFEIDDRGEVSIEYVINVTFDNSRFIKTKDINQSVIATSIEIYDFNNADYSETELIDFLTTKSEQLEYGIV